MTGGAEVAVCPICRCAVNDDDPKRNPLSLGADLSFSGCSVSRFLSKYNVFHDDGFDAASRLCSGCSELVVRCDELHFSLYSTVDSLRKKTTPGNAGGSVGSFVFVKHESDQAANSDRFESMTIELLPKPIIPLDEREDCLPSSPEEKCEETFGVDEDRSPSGDPVEDEDEPKRGARPARKSAGSVAKFCPVCGEPAVPGKFMQHLRLAHPGQKRVKPVPADWYRCELCPFKAKHKDRVEKHMLLKHRIGKMIPCPDCDHMLTTKERLLAHAHLVHGKAKAFRCDECGREFSSYPGLYAHSKFHSSEVVVRVCEECGEEVDSRRYLHHVWSRHKPKRVEESSCEHCGKTFKCRKGLVKHLARFHGVGVVRKVSNEISKECPECGKSIKSDELFYAHLFSAHGIEKPGLKRRPCPHCDEVFYVKDKLDAHVMLHTGEKKYVCADCGYSTRFSGNLYKHRKGVHGKGSGEKKDPVLE